VLIVNNSQVIGNTAVEPSIATSQPLTSVYKSHSSSLQNNTSKVIPTKKCTVIMPATISNNPLVQVTPSSSITSTLTPSTSACGTFQQKIQNKKPMANNYPHRAVGHIIVIENKQYKLVMEQRQLKAVYMPPLSISPLVQGIASSSDTTTSTPTITTCQSVNGPSGQMRAEDNGTLVSQPTVIIRVCTIH